jgi:hypothetical protein
MARASHREEPGSLAPVAFFDPSPTGTLNIQKNGLKLSKQTV